MGQDKDDGRAPQGGASRVVAASEPARRARPRLASDLLEPGLVLAQPGGLEEALARELESAHRESSFSGAQPLDASLFDGELKAAPSTRPTSGNEDPTLKVDLTPGGQRSQLSDNFGLPMPEPRRLQTRQATEMQTSSAAPAPANDPSALRAPLPSNIGPSPDRGIQGLPLGARPAAPQPPPEAVLVNLPCNLLLFDDDAKAGAVLAARLIEFGFTCRIVNELQLDSTLSQLRFDAAIVEIPAEEAQRDQGKGRLQRLRAFTGPVVITSAANLPVESFGSPSPVRASLSRPFFTEALIAAIEQARAPASQPAPAARGSTTRPPPSPAAFPSAPPPPPTAPQRTPSGPKAKPETAQSAPMPPPSTSPVDKAKGALVALPPANRKDELPLAEPSTGDLSAITDDLFDLTELDVNVVRAIVTTEDQRVLRGRVRSMAPEGRILVELKEPLEPDSHVVAEFVTVDGTRAEVLGQVVGSTHSEMGIELELPSELAPIVKRFMQEALDITQPGIEQVRIRVQEAATPIEEMVADEVGLATRWVEVKDRLDDDVIQQRFIQDCLKAQKLDFAVQCYRELKQADPNDPRAAKYLNQVGTILSFVAFRKDVAIEEKGMPLRLKVALGAFLAAALTLIAIVWILR